MTQAAGELDPGEPFDFVISPVGLVSVVHRGDNLRWEFVVEAAHGRRFLQPVKTRMTAIDRRATAPLRRQAFAFAVAQARGRDVID